MAGYKTLNGIPARARAAYQSAERAMVFDPGTRSVASKVEWCLTHVYGAELLE